MQLWQALRKTPSEQVLLLPLTSAPVCFHSSRMGGKMSCSNLPGKRGWERGNSCCLLPIQQLLTETPQIKPCRCQRCLQTGSLLSKKIQKNQYAGAQPAPLADLLPQLKHITLPELPKSEGRKASCMCLSATPQPAWEYWRGCWAPTLLPQITAWDVRDQKGDFLHGMEKKKNHQHLH